MKLYLELENERVLAWSSSPTNQDNVEIEIEEEHPILFGVFGWVFQKGKLFKDESKWPVPVKKPEPPSVNERMDDLEWQNASLLVNSILSEVELEKQREEMIKLDLANSELFLSNMLSEIDIIEQKMEIEALDVATSEFMLDSLMTKMDLEEKQEDIDNLDIAHSELLISYMNASNELAEQQEALLISEPLNAQLLLAQTIKEVN